MNQNQTPEQQEEITVAEYLEMVNNDEIIRLRPDGRIRIRSVGRVTSDAQKEGRELGVSLRKRRAWYGSEYRVTFINMDGERDVLFDSSGSLEQAEHRAKIASEEGEFNHMAFYVETIYPPQVVSVYANGERYAPLRKSNTGHSVVIDIDLVENSVAALTDLLDFMEAQNGGEHDDEWLNLDIARTILESLLPNDLTDEQADIELATE